MAPRNFSFGSGDERPIHPDEQERLNQNFEHHHYHDSAARQLTSPPPQYPLPEPPDSPIPTSPTPAFHFHSQQRLNRSSPESRSEHTDQDESPPPPPPHRSSTASSTQRSSLPRKPIVMPYNTVHRHDDRSRQSLHSHTAQDQPFQEGTSGAYTPPRRPAFQTVGVGNQSRGISPHPLPLRPTSHAPEQNSYSSNLPLAVGAATPGSITPITTPDVRSSRYSGHSIPLTDHSTPSHHHMAVFYSNSPYHNSSHDFDPTVSNASINPQHIIDDGDDGFMSQPKRKSALSFGTTINKGSASAATYAVTNNKLEKNNWMSKDNKHKRRVRGLAGVAIGAVIVLAVIGGIVGGVFGSRRAAENGGSSQSYNNAQDDIAANGDLNINSAEIKGLMNNPNLHKVFPGVDYTPWGVQYPLCLQYPPSQNNVTRDIAVISQLTNTVRLYGTDCNQTEMVLHAIDRLQLKNMKVWIGVWIDLGPNANQTTNKRQIAHMYHLLEEIKDHSILKGVIIGNEALFRAADPAAPTSSDAVARQELITILQNAKSNFTTLGYNVPVGTSDLGDKWDASLVAASDFVMSNVHPFFAGVQAEVAAAWTYDFWQTHDVSLTAQSPNKEQIISEAGWPSGGGKNCGGADGSCAAGQSGSVASIDNMNTFMNTWVCQALANQTNYFWFEAFDEAWKIQFNTPGREWEDKWGLMDPGRKLKSGVKIPDCGGRTV